MTDELKAYALDLPGEDWTEEDRSLLTPFATNPDGVVSVLHNLPAEIVGALCSRASRASGSLLRVLLKEYFYPILNGENQDLAGELRATVAFLKTHGFKNILNNQRAQEFYAKWLSQYGDDSIAQLTGTHVVMTGISQVAMKFLEDQRIALEPIEQSTRYVQFGNKVGGRYRYYVPKPDLERLGLLDRYRSDLDHLFDTYVALQPPLIAWLKQNYEEKDSVLEKKAFDTLRGLLPMATLGQVALRGNAQAWEHWLNRSGEHLLGELRWLSAATKMELDQEIPSLLLRANDPKSQEHRKYLAGKSRRVKDFLWHESSHRWYAQSGYAEQTPAVKLVEYDPDAEKKILTAILFPVLNKTWEETREMVDQALQAWDRKAILEKYLEGRKARWQKPGRAFENSYLRFEIVMNIGAYRDLQRHRMMTQERQIFSCTHDYDLPPELEEAGLAGQFRSALDQAKELWFEIAKKREEPELAQYVVPMAYRVRFYQWQNFRQLFWETELRTTSQGHPDYRWIEQEKFRLVAEKFPNLAELMLVDTKDYAFARRGTEEKIAAKEAKLLEEFGKRGEDK